MTARGHAARWIALATAYVAAVAGSALFVLPGYPLTLMWAPAGIALAGLLWLDRSALAVLVPAAVVAAWWLPVSPTAHPAVAAGLIAGPWLAYELLRASRFAPTLVHGRSAVNFALAATAGSAVSALAIFGALVLGQGMAAYKAATIAPIWFLSDLVGYVSIVPPVLVVLHHREVELPEVRGWQYMLGVAVAGLLAHLSFGDVGWLGPSHDQLAVLLLGVHIIITVRFGLAHGAFAIGLVVVLMAIDVAAGSAVATQHELLERVNWFYGFATTNALVNLALGTVLRERMAAEDQLALAQAAVDAAGDAVLWAGVDGQMLYANAAAQRLVGLDPVARAMTMAQLDGSLTPTRLQQLAVGADAGPVHAHGRFVRADGTEVDVELACNLVRRGSRMFLSVIARDVSERVARERALTWDAMHDPLTGLANRAQVLAALQARFGPDGARSPFAVLFVDLDHFKEVNDTLGHAAGDALLVEVGARLRASVRERDMVARLGGDEFVVLVDGTDDPVIIERAQVRIQSTLSQTFALDAGQVTVSASVGAARSGDGHSDAESMLHRADAAMYRAKRASHAARAVPSGAVPIEAGEDGEEGELLEP